MVFLGGAVLAEIMKVCQGGRRRPALPRAACSRVRAPRAAPHPQDKEDFWMTKKDYDEGGIARVLAKLGPSA